LDVINNLEVGFFYHLMSISCLEYKTLNKAVRN
jgi:hypothetical protein